MRNNGILFKRGNNMAVILEYKNVCKSFGEKEILKDVNLQIESKKIKIDPERSERK